MMIDAMGGAPSTLLRTASGKILVGLQQEGRNVPASLSIIHFQLSIYIIVALLLPLCLSAQSTDLQTRTGIQIKQDLRKGFDLAVGYQARTDHSTQRFRGSYFTADLGYKLTDNSNVLFEFRYATSPRWDKFRFGIGYMAKTKIGKISFSAKLRYQYEHFLQSWPEIGQYPERQNIRLKLEAERKLIKHLRGHISVEPQFRFNGIHGSFQRIRNIAGVEWEIAKRHHLDFSYYYQPQFNAREVKHVHVAEVTYTWDLPKKWRKRKVNNEK